MRPAGLHLLRLGLALVAAHGAALWAQPQMVPPRVLEEPIWNFPLAAQRDGVRHGQVHALLSIGTAGELVDFLVLGCTHPALGEEVAAALPGYRFAPARVRGEPRPVRFPVTFQFRQESALVSFQLQHESFLERATPKDDDRNFVWLLCPAHLIDRPLTPTETVAPEYPRELLASQVTGEVTIEFYVDATGRVRLPAVKQEPHPSFGREAMAALLAWRFEPPTRAGRPTIVRVEQLFRFKPPPP